MPTLYITEQGARLEKEYKRIAVVKEDNVLMTVPLARIDQVVLVGNVGVTTPALHALLDAQVGLTLLNSWGDLRGHLQPETHKHLALRHSQYQCTQDRQGALAICKAMVTGKLCNARAMAQRITRRHQQIQRDDLRVFDDSLRQLDSANDLATLRGIEGNAAKSYFQIFWQALPANLQPSRRSRRPPADPANALLSLGYTLLTQNMLAACEVVGLDPYDGFYHADEYGRPALALDLIEEFRSIIVDSVVLNLLNRKMLGADDFQPGPEGGVYLKSAAMRIFFTQYSKRLHAQVLHPLAGRRISYQKCFEVQARQLRKVIEGETERYIPFLTR